MNIFLCGLFVAITRNVVYTAPAKNQFIDSIKEKCPADLEYVFQELKLPNCSVWDNLHINETKLTSENEQHFRCLLFQDSFLSFCRDITNLKIKLPKLEVQTIHSYTTEQVCKDLFPANRTLDHELPKIIIPRKCEKFCTDYDTDEPVVECSMAYFFAHISISSLTSPLNQENSEVVRNISSQILPPHNQSLDQPESSASKPNGTISHNISLSDSNRTDTKQTQKPPKESKDNLNDEHGADSQIIGSNAANNPSLNPGQSSETAGTIHNPKDDVNAQPKQDESVVSTLKKKEDNSENPPDPQTIQKESSETNKGEFPNNEQTYITVNDNKTPDIAQPASLKGAETLSTNSEVEVDAKLDKNNVEKEEDSPVKPVLEDNEIGEQEEDDIDEDLERVPQQLMDDAPELQETPVEDKKPKETKISNTLESAANEENIEELDGDSYFFSYFMVICVLFVLGYVGYHNRIKVMALVLEGKRNKRQYRGRRPNSANYHKLDSNLEEAISSTCTKNATNVIY